MINFAFQSTLKYDPELRIKRLLNILPEVEVAKKTYR